MAFRQLCRPRLRLRPHTATTRSVFTSSTGSTSRARSVLYGALLLVPTSVFVVYYLDARSGLHRYVLTPTLRTILDAEAGHKVAVGVLKVGLGPRDPLADDETLKSSVWGRQISNPIGLAAGFDKDGEAIDGLFDLGFSWVEIGSVTPKPQAGNPKPRVFHLPEDSALINRYGFPSQGHEAVLSRLRNRIPTFRDQVTETSTASLRAGDLLAINLGKNKISDPDSIDDFITGVNNFSEYADVLVVNVSSPNTPGLRGLQNRDQLEKLLSGVVKARDALPPSSLTNRRPRLLVKLAPDLEQPQLVEIADVISSSKVDGVIFSNTTIQRPISLTAPAQSETGGLSGQPLKPLTLKALSVLRSHLPESIPIIGCGGISSGSDALEYAKAGASLVQVYTGFGYDGAGTARRIKDELTAELKREGTTWAQVVKGAVSKLSETEEQRKERVRNSSIAKLIDEAKELEKALDKLSASLEEESLDTIGAESVPTPAL